MMNDKSPAGRGSRRRPGGMHNENSTAEFAERIDLRAKLSAIIAEARRGDPEECVIPIAEGILEDLDEILGGAEL